eukprot:CAMPEP_0114147846 /NCGR_PEP_ID=MMETSP0043_2-20121206/21322_1 /TAXON_ID=464988 /ORGANISM="Hemiselmis andersenii, Strain CCMP644" /LENGTH=40 /DNA_ID= /DNA_START= /DNA_END= /DNA_ORIENTATION=
MTLGNLVFWDGRTALQALTAAGEGWRTSEQWQGGWMGNFE